MYNFYKTLFLLITGLSVVFNFSAQEGSKALPEISSDVIQNPNIKGVEKGINLSWSLDYDYLNYLKDNGYKISIKYNTSIKAKNKDVDSWSKIEKLDIGTTSYKIKNLAAGEKYVVKVGVSNSHQKYWSKKLKAKTDRPWGMFKFLVLIGSLGMFIYGMKIMSEGLQQAAGSKLRNLLGSITSNRVKGVLTGFGLTSIVQSSSVTTVMTVSFVNAGLMTLTQSAGVMMGANIGTTITGWLINIFGFKVSIASYALVFIAIGSPFLFVGKKKVKAWASAIIGFSLLFMGLSELKGAVPELSSDSALVQFFVDYKDIPILSTLMFVLLGTLITIIIQSSSAAMALTMTLVASGMIPFEVATAMVLGENIGTTITAELASMIGNVHAKRSARIHTMFNLIGVVWAIIVFPFFLDGIALLMKTFNWGDPFNNPAEHANTGLAIFHTSFNLLNVLVFIGFVPHLVRLAEKTVKSKGAADLVFHLDYIGTGMMATPELSLLEAKKEIAKFGGITSRMSKFTRSLLYEKSLKVKGEIHERISKYEDITDRVEVEVANYLNKISEGELSPETSSRIRGMNSIVNDLERIGDIYFQISKSIERKNEEKIWFSPEERNNLNTMLDLVDDAFVIMNDNLNSHHDEVTLESASVAEERINAKRNELKKEYFENISNNQEYNIKGGMIYNDIFSSLEKVGDHIINVSEAIIGRI